METIREILNSDPQDITICIKSHYLGGGQLRDGMSIPICDVCWKVLCET